MTEQVAPGITQRLADFNLGLKYEDLPPEVITEAKNGILDTLGVALVGSTEEPTQILLRASTSSRDSGKATVLGARTLTTPTVAALINGYAAHVLDYDDTQHYVGTHMSAPVVPAALALAEMLHRSGKDLLTAYVAGFEVGCRLGRSGGFANHLLRQRMVASAILGVIGAAAAAAKLMDLDSLKMRRSFGIAAGHAAGFTMSFGTMAKAQNLGNAAQNGVLSALLAREGFTGPEQIFDGEKNIFSLYGGRTDEDELFRNLGQKFEMTSNTRKIFACAGWRNPIIEATIFLAETHALQPEDIKKVNVAACMDVKHLPNYPAPRIGLEAKFSAQYAAAVALMDRAGGVAQFTDERAADPALAQLTRKVTLEYDEALGPFQTRVAISTHDGRELSHFIPVQKGKHLNPMTWEELATKFRANAATALPQGQVETLTAMIRDFENLDDVAELMRLCHS